ncbi:MAG: PEP-CTERM sorting domain-containing protein [Acidiferrobacteraceae bacterium]
MLNTMLRKTLLAAALVGVALNAHAMQVQNMTAGNGNYFVTLASGSNSNSIGSNWTNTVNPGANLVGGFVNLGQISTNLQTANQQSGYPYAFTSNGTTAPDGGTATGFSAPVPSFTVTATSATTGTISGNLSAWTLYYSGVNYNQRPTDNVGNSIPITGTWDPSTGAYSLSWGSFTTLSGGTTVTSTWTMNGIATPVPEASTSAMMLVGLTLVGGMTVVRRRRPSA